jgi:hypothetical protein
MAHEQGRSLAILYVSWLGCEHLRVHSASSARPIKRLQPGKWSDTLERSIFLSFSLLSAFMSNRWSPLSDQGHHGGTYRAGLCLLACFSRPLLP